MRIAVSGAHGTGKSTLISAFLAQRPEYVHEPEAYEALADDISLTAAEGPDLEGLAALLEYTAAALIARPSGTSAIFERSPVDYLAYAAATRSIPTSDRTAFIAAHAPRVRESVRHLDLIVFLPVSRSGPVQARAYEGARYRRRVDGALRGALIDDDYGLFEETGGPLVLELSADPERQLPELLRRTSGSP